MPYEGPMTFGETPTGELPELPIPEEILDDLSDELAHNNAGWLIYWNGDRPKALVGHDYQTPVGRLRVQTVKVFKRMADHPYSYYFSPEKQKKIDKQAKGKILHLVVEPSHPDEVSENNLRAVEDGQ